MLESLVLEAIGEDEITKCADAFYDCLEKEAQLNLQKAREPRSRLSVYVSGKSWTRNMQLTMTRVAGSSRRQSI